MPDAPPTKRSHRKRPQPRTTADAYYFPFEAKEWRSSESVGGMSLAERGAFIELLAAAWIASAEPCSIPSSDEEIARVLRVQVSEWILVAPRVLAEFDLTTESGRLRNEKLWNLYQRMRTEHKRKSQGGKTSALRRRDTHGRLLPSAAQDTTKTLGKTLSGSQSHSQSQSQVTTPAPREPQRAAPKFPDFPKEQCDELHTLWGTFGIVDYPVFRKALGPAFSGPNRRTFEDVKAAMVEAIDHANRGLPDARVLTIHTFAQKLGYWIGEAKGRPVGVDPATGIMRRVAS